MSEKSATPWAVPGKWTVSQHNWADEVRSGWDLPASITVHDVTLRDGEQTPGVVFRLDDKLKIAHALAEAGVQRIEAGMAGVSQEDADAISRISREVKNAEIASFCRTIKGDVDLALKCGVGRVIIEMTTIEPAIKGIWGSREKAAEVLADLVRYAKGKGIKVTLFFLDFSKAPLDLLKLFIAAGVDEGKADSVTVVDTRGFCLPNTIFYLVKQVKGWVNVPVEIHCHNQWGMGTANTLAGVAAGAEVVHTCINGLGGNAAIDECIMGIEGMLGVSTGVNPANFYETSQIVKEYAKADWYKPWIGDTIPYVEIGMVTKMMWDDKEKPGYGRTDMMNLTLVGNEAVRLVLGKKSGKYSIMLKAHEMGLPMPTDEECDKMLNQVKDFGTEKKGLLTDEEFRKIYQAVKG